MSNQQCREKAGFLFSHRCERPAAAQCRRCSRPVCAQHKLEDEQGTLCVTCGKKLRSRQGHRDDFDSHDSPYLYASYYYEGYGYYGRGSWAYDYHQSQHMDPHDFSEADGASLQPGDEDFEHDMGAS